MKTIVCSSIAVLLSPLFSSHLHALDVRSIGMGGASVSSGIGINGAISNPSSLMAAQRRKERYHFGLDLNGEIRDSVDILQEFSDNENLIDDIETEIDILSAQSLTCNPILDPGTATCLTNTGNLGALAGDALDVFNKANGRPVDGQGAGDLGFAVSHTAIPFFINVGTQVTGFGVTDITDTDIEYAQTLNEVLGDDSLTLQEILVSAPIEYNPATNSVDIEIPDDILDSTATAGAVIRTQLSIGMAKTLTVGGKKVDFGVTPKVSSLRASDLRRNVAELSDINLQDELEANDTTATTFTFDFGVSLPLPKKNLKLAGVIKNVVPESIKTASGANFDTTPQVIVSAAYSKNWYTFTGDLALNEASYDNFDTQRLSLGTELSKGMFHFRAGILHDLAVDNDPTSFNVGLGVGFFNLAASVNGANVRGGVNLSYSIQ